MNLVRIEILGFEYHLGAFFDLFLHQSEQLREAEGTECFLTHIDSEARPVA